MGKVGGALMLDWDAVKQLLEEFDVTEMPDRFWPARGVEEDAIMHLSVALADVYGASPVTILASMHLAVLLAEKTRPSVLQIRNDLNWAIGYVSTAQNERWRQPLLLELQRITDRIVQMEAP